MNGKIAKRKIRALVVDDSVFMGMQIARILNGDDEIEVVGRARDGVEALSMVGELRPDVVTLDLEMPGQDGMTTLKHIMVRYPLPTVIISAHTTKGSKSTRDAIRFGAIDIIAKPSDNLDESLVAQKDEIVAKVKRAAAIGTGRCRYTKLSSFNQRSTGASISRGEIPRQAMTWPARTKTNSVEMLACERDSPEGRAALLKNLFSQAT